MAKCILIFLLIFSIPLTRVLPSFSSERPDHGQAMGAVQKMASAFKKVEDYTCEVEVIYFQDGIEDQRYQFKFYFKREKRIRIDFYRPYSSLTLFYKEGDREATVRPFRFFPALTFKFSIDHSLIKTQSGQRIDQTDMGYFIHFLFKNLERVRQGKDEFYEDDEQVRLLVWAMDYIEGKTLEKYRISISKRHWLPIQIQRYNLEGQVREVTLIKNYIINAPLEEMLFIP